MDNTATEPDEQPAEAPLWTPAPEGYSLLRRFMHFIREHKDVSFEDYANLHVWSIDYPEDFWEAVWDFTGIVGARGNIVLQRSGKVPYARFFPDSTINYAENALKHTQERPDKPAIIARTQDGPDRIIRWQDLYDQVSIWTQALENAGLEKGDRISVYLPNIPETIIILLAASNIGAVFSSAGMEMGPDDLISRLGQVQPKILVTANGYVHGPKTISRMDALTRLSAEIQSIQTVIMLPLIPDDDTATTDAPDHYVMREDFLAGYNPEPLTFTRHDFNHPLYILFSSGTTGKPKCFEHSTGGILLKHMCEMQLNTDIRPGDVLFYHATPSWMMWNWLVSGLCAGATLLMYDGSPAYPDAHAQWTFTSAHGCTHHGTAAPVILSWQTAGLMPGTQHDLSSLRVLLSTGAVLPAQSFHYIHEAVKADIRISSISGGTDIVGCFLGGNPLMPTYAGQINGPMLGMDVQVWTDDGTEAGTGETGELVCANAFPSMPLRFLDDKDGERYSDEYFAHYPSRKVWRHGDCVTKTAQEQFIIVGRSDATLNQNGVRIGAGAIYKQLEHFKDQITDAAAVDFIRPDNKQTITVLFVLKTDGTTDPVADSLQIAIRDAVKRNITPYAMPTEIIAVPDILKTPNGKKAEVVIKKVINGTVIPNPSLYGEDLVAFYAQIGQHLTQKYSG